MPPSVLPGLPSADLDYMFQGLGESGWRFFSEKRLFITGGSGFIGKWLLSALLEANRRLSLNCQIEVLTRSSQRFRKFAPHIACAEGVILHQGDVRDFYFPKGDFDIIVHGATDVTTQNLPLEIFSTCVEGTQRVLEFAHYSNADDFLLMSSGAVYGQHPCDPMGLSEDYIGALPLSAYGEGKRISERLAYMSAAKTKLQVKIARIYAQVGPYLPMDKHFAIGNFITDVLANREIIIRGDGTPLRSYLYVADTAIWLWAMVLIRERARVWNVGGKEGISIEDLAKRVASILGSNKGIKILTPFDPASRRECYVPDTSRARRELNVPPSIALDDAILRTVDWMRSKK